MSLFHARCEPQRVELTLQALPWCRELASLTSLAGALAPMLQQFMRRATLLQDTSMFLEKTLAQQCLHGSAPRDADCTGLDACSSGADSEEEDFDMSAYMDLSPHRRSFSDDEKLEPCESLVRGFSAGRMFPLMCTLFAKNSGCLAQPLLSHVATACCAGAAGKHIQ